MYKAVFSDIDGTLLNNAHRITPKTQQAILRLQEKNIPFVLVSARSPTAIEPIRQRYGFSGPLIAFSGALILDAAGETIHSQGFDLRQARAVIEFAESRRFDMAWCLYSAGDWLVRSRLDPKVRFEEDIVEIQATDLPYGVWPGEQPYYKIMGICNPKVSADIEKHMQAAFPHLRVVRSSDMMLEIMPGGIGKGQAVHALCRHLGVDPKDAIALGDNYNDLDMLRAVGCPVVMGNAPESIRREFPFVTDDNEHDGVAGALEKLVK